MNNYSKFFNQLKIKNVYGPLLFYLGMIYLHKKNKMEILYDKCVVDKNISYKILVKEFIQQWIIFDLLFYLVHKYLFHHKYFYKIIHSTHHQMYNPMLLSTFYAGFIENLITYFLIFIPSLLIPVNKESLYVYVLSWLIYTFESHNSNSKIFSHHVKHHKFLTINFGLTKLFDIIFIHH